MAEVHQADYLPSAGQVGGKSKIKNVYKLLDKKINSRVDDINNKARIRYYKL